MVPCSLSSFAVKLMGCDTAPWEGTAGPGTVKFYGCVRSVVAWGTLAGKELLLRWKDAQGQTAGE